VLDDLAEAMKALDGKKMKLFFRSQMRIGEDFGVNLEQCQLRNVRLNHFFNSLRSSCFIFAPEFFEAPEPIFV